jgi:hypothetical protein
MITDFPYILEDLEAILSLICCWPLFEVDVVVVGVSLFSGGWFGGCYTQVSMFGVCSVVQVGVVPVPPYLDTVPVQTGTPACGMLLPLNTMPCSSFSKGAKPYLLFHSVSPSLLFDGTFCCSCACLSVLPGEEACGAVCLSVSYISLLVICCYLLCLTGHLGGCLPSVHLCGDHICWLWLTISLPT